MSRRSARGRRRDAGSAGILAPHVERTRGRLLNLGCAARALRRLDRRVRRESGLDSSIADRHVETGRTHEDRIVPGNGSWRWRSHGGRSRAPREINGRCSIVARCRGRASRRFSARHHDERRVRRASRRARRGRVTNAIGRPDPAPAPGAGRLLPRMGRPPLRRLVGSECYVVPRLDGSILVGATVEAWARRAHDRGGISEMWMRSTSSAGNDDQHYSSKRRWSAPATTDELPVIGRIPSPRLITRQGTIGTASCSRRSRPR